MIIYDQLNLYVLTLIDESIISNKDYVKNKYNTDLKLANMAVKNAEITRLDLIAYVNNFINSINRNTSYEINTTLVPSSSNTSEKLDYISKTTVDKKEYTNSIQYKQLKKISSDKSDSDIAASNNFALASIMTAILQNLTNIVNSKKVAKCKFDYSAFDAASRK